LGYPIIRYTCTKCAREEHGGNSGRSRYYQLEDGCYLPLYSCYGWCFSCNGLREIEDTSLDSHIATIRRLSASLASAVPRWRWFTKTWDCKSYHWLDTGLSISHEVNTESFHEMARVLDEASHQIDYLSRRTAPSTCLKCSGHEVERLIPFESGDMRGWNHPGCGGNFVMEIRGSWNLGRSATRLIYTTDGKFSHEEQLPPNTAPWPNE